MIKKIYLIFPSVVTLKKSFNFETLKPLFYGRLLTGQPFMAYRGYGYICFIFKKFPAISGTGTYRMIKREFYLCCGQDFFCALAP